MDINSSERMYKINGKIPLFSKYYYVDMTKKGYIVLDLNTQCESENLDEFPVLYVECDTDIERYELFKYNVVLGSREELCLI